MFELLIFSAVVADCFFGDPKWFPHPVRIIGLMCSIFETFFRKIIRNEKTAGIFTSLTVLILSGGGVALLLYLLGVISERLQIIFAVFVIYTFIAIKDLLLHSKNVFKNLYPIEKITEARVAVGLIVGRDTSYLQQEEICRACVETVAENMVDGITAPLFWSIMFSLLALVFPVNPIALAAIGISLYKAANTMDSMFGYKNEKYIEFGWFSARFDDLINLIPARLSGVCVIISAFLAGDNWRKGYEIFYRDRLNHTSPNAAHTEAAVAGAFGIQLGGSSVYFGKKIEKPTIGDCDSQISPHHILKSHKIIIISTIVFLVLTLLLRRILLFFLA